MSNSPKEIILSHIHAIQQQWREHICLLGLCQLFWSVLLFSLSIYIGILPVCLTGLGVVFFGFRCLKNYFRHLNPLAAAQLIDQHWQLEQRVSSSYAVLEDSSQPILYSLLLQDAASYLSKKQAIIFSPPRRQLYLVGVAFIFIFLTRLAMPAIVSKECRHNQTTDIIAKNIHQAANLLSEAGKLKEARKLRNLVKQIRQRGKNENNILRPLHQIISQIMPQQNLPPSQLSLLKILVKKSSSRQHVHSQSMQKLDSSLKEQILSLSKKQQKKLRKLAQGKLSSKLLGMLERQKKQKIEKWLNKKSKEQYAQRKQKQAFRLLNALANAFFPKKNAQKALPFSSKIPQHAKADSSPLANSSLNQTISQSSNKMWSQISQRSKQFSTISTTPIKKQFHQKSSKFTFSSKQSNFTPRLQKLWWPSAYSKVVQRYFTITTKKEK